MRIYGLQPGREKRAAGRLSVSRGRTFVHFRCQAPQKDKCLFLVPGTDVLRETRLLVWVSRRRGSFLFPRLNHDDLPSVLNSFYSSI